MNYLALILVNKRWNSFTFHAIERLEHLVRTSYIHDIQHELSSNWIQLPTAAYKEQKIFFIHIPRTSGNSLRTDLIGRNRPWVIDYAWWKKENVPFDINHRRHGSASAVYEQWSNESIVVIKGWFSYKVVQEYGGVGHANKKIMTIIRYPTERIYSLYKRLTTYGKTALIGGNDDGDDIDDNQRCLLYRLFYPIQIGNRTLLNERQTKHISFYDFLNIENCRLQAMITNYMSWQFGDEVVLKRCLSILQNDTLHRIQFERAKQHLLQFDFVGFYEDMIVDFERLHDTLFADMQGTFLSRTIFNMGTVIASPRMRVLKYTQTMTENEIALLKQKNQYDIMLYLFMKERLNKTFNLYRSYSEYVLGTGVVV